MLPPCPRCGKDNFKSSRDRNAHINRRIPCTPRITEVVSHPSTILEPDDSGDERTERKNKVSNDDSLKGVKADLSEMDVYTIVECTYVCSIVCTGVVECT